MVIGEAIDFSISGMQDCRASLESMVLFFTLHFTRSLTPALSLSMRLRARRALRPGRDASFKFLSGIFEDIFCPSLFFNSFSVFSAISAVSYYFSTTISSIEYFKELTTFNYFDSRTVTHCYSGFRLIKE